MAVFLVDDLGLFVFFFLFSFFFFLPAINVF